MQIVKAEAETAVRLLGVEKVTDLRPHHVNARAVERDTYDGVEVAGMEKLGLWVRSKLKSHVKSKSWDHAVGLFDRDFL